MGLAIPNVSSLLFEIAAAAKEMDNQKRIDTTTINTQETCPKMYRLIVDFFLWSTYVFGAALGKTISQGGILREIVRISGLDLRQQFAFKALQFHNQILSGLATWGDGISLCRSPERFVTLLH